MSTLLIDNYDSFTFNLAAGLRCAGADVVVLRNDAAELDSLGTPTSLVLSPGPGRPEDAGRMPELLARWWGQVPILGVCLGHQAIVQHAGGSVVHAPRPIHGMDSAITHDGRGIFAGIPSPTRVGRYHSLVGNADDLPPDLEVTARTADGVIMAVRSRSVLAVGIQFHPESILSADGQRMLDTFVQISGSRR